MVHDDIAQVRPHDDGQDCHLRLSAGGEGDEGFQGFRQVIPAALAEVRTKSWERFVWPGGFARLFQRNGVAVMSMLFLGASLLFALSSISQPGTGDGFYGAMSHTLMVAVFTPAFLLPLVAAFTGVRRYWTYVGGGTVRMSHLVAATLMVARMKDLSGGQEQGCNFEIGDRYSNARRWLHQAVLCGFLLCLAATGVGALMHYLFDMPAPYHLLSLPKLMGVPGGLLLMAGSAGLAYVKTKAAKNLGAANTWGGEMAFVLLLFAVAATGLGLYGATGSALVPALLSLHLGAVLAFFVLIPYSKMVHGFFRLAALVRDAQSIRQ